MANLNRIRIPLLCGLTVLILGCSSSDERLARFAAESNRQQSEQNRRMAELQQEVAAGSRRMIEAEAAHQSQMLALEESLQEEREKIDRGRDALENERRAFAAERRRESLWTTLIHEGMALLAGLLPLVIAIRMLTSKAAYEPAAGLCDLLISEVASNRPRLAPCAPRARIAGPEADPDDPDAAEGDASRVG